MMLMLRSMEVAISAFVAACIVIFMFGDKVFGGRDDD